MAGDQCRRRFFTIDHAETIKTVMRSGRYPAPVFLFSRRTAEEAACAMAGRFHLVAPETGDAAARRFDADLSESSRGLHASLRRCVSSGIGYHHAGMLPSAKRLVEPLFVEGLAPVVFCTEPFSLGVNYPAKTVVIGQVTKRDDHGFRPLTNREFLQMAGRAGRRGQDRRGYAYICVDPAYPDEAPTEAPDTPEPVTPQTAITPDGVLQLIDGLGPDRDRLRRYMGKSFGGFAWARARAGAAASRDAARRALDEAFAGVGCGDLEKCAAFWK